MSKNKFPVAVFLTDTHKQKDNLDLVYGIFIQALDLAEKLKCKYVFHGGDFFNDRIGQNLTNLLMFQEILNEFERRQITLVGIPGNHDKTDQESEKSYLSIFKSPYFILFEKQGVFKMKNGMDFHFLPFFSKSMPERLEDLKTRIIKNKSILIAHAAFNGVRNNDGSKAKDGLKKKSVKEYNKVLVGHYHDASLIGNNIYFTGSAYQANFGENIEDKGFTVIYDDYSIKSVKSKFKKYIKVSLDVDCDLETEIEAVQDLDANLRFVFEGNKSDLSKLDTKKLDSLGIDYKFEWNDINEEILKVEGGEFGSLDKKTVLKFFLEYCKIQSIESKQRTFGLKILN
jgi:DNA repair exonuclease SbcCD nuclease subunit